MAKKSTGRTRSKGTKGKKGKKIGLGTFVVVLLLVVAFLVLNYYYGPFFEWIPLPTRPALNAPLEGEHYSETAIKEEELSIHFLELGVKNTGDCELIKVGNIEVLIDAGAKVASIPTLKSYIDRYCTDGVLEYVIVTHAHEDHYAGFATNETTKSIFDLYTCETIITFSQVTSGKTDQGMYKNFERKLSEAESKGAKHYTAEECVKEENGAKREYDLGSGVTLEILDSYYYYHVSTTENDHSVCTMIRKQTETATKNYLFTGDLEKKGEEYLVSLNNLPKVEVYKAGHHGSKTSSNDILMKVIQPKIICVCCCAGSSEYTSTQENQFPTQDFINRVAPYTQSVYVTTICENYKAGDFKSMNGNIAVCYSAAKGTTVYCSGSVTPLKDTEWFKKNRTCPAAWA